MRLNSIRVRDFKRFSDLTIKDIPSTTKLVLLTGPNGSGKTSIFESFNYWMNWARGQNHFDQEYHARSAPGVNTNANALWNAIELTFHGETSDIRHDAARNRKAFYIRSAYRHEPDFTSNGLSNADDILLDSRRATRLIMAESRVSENYQRMVADSIMALYDPAQGGRSAGDITEELIGDVRVSMQNVFGDLTLQGPGNPMTGGTFRFEKGASSGFHYKNLSGGEKAAFDILLDFIAKRRAFDDTIFCIDEPELHMHTRLQAKLLEEMFGLIPDNCQLWLSTHSIGMARKAAELHAENPDQIAFIDFHNQDFDVETTLTPVQPNRIYWKNMFATALDDLAELVIPRAVVFCEGRRLGISGRKPSFDVEVYRTIFGSHHPEVEFVPLGGTTEVKNDGQTFSLLLTQLAPAVQIWKVFDLDDRHVDEVAKLKLEGIQVLERRDIESYLWDDEVIQALCDQKVQASKAEIITKEKERLLAQLAQQGKPSDDIKSITGELYNFCKRELTLVQCGNDAEAFACLTLAPLIQPGLAVYEELERIVLGPLRK